MESSSIGRPIYDLYGMMYQRTHRIFAESTMLPLDEIRNYTQQLEHCQMLFVYIKPDKSVLRYAFPMDHVYRLNDQVTEAVQSLLDDLSEGSELPDYHLRWTEAGLGVIRQENREPPRYLKSLQHPGVRNWRCVREGRYPHETEECEIVHVEEEMLRRMVGCDFYYRDAIAQLAAGEYLEFDVVVRSKGKYNDGIDKLLDQRINIINTAIDNMQDRVRDLLDKAAGSHGGGVLHPYRIVTFAQPYQGKFEDPHEAHAHMVVLCPPPLMNDSKAANLVRDITQERVRIRSAV